MGQINLLKTSGSAVLTPRTGFVSMFVDENETLKAKTSSGTILPSILTADSASYAQSAVTSKTAEYTVNATSIYTSNAATSANQPIAWNTAKYESSNINNRITWSAGNTNFKLAVGGTYKIEWILPGYFGNTNYYKMMMQYSDNGGSTWQLLRGGDAYASVSNGGGTNWGGGGYAVDFTIGSATRLWRVLTETNGVPAGPTLVISLS